MQSLPRPNRHLSTPYDVRKYFRLKEDGKIFAILNGFDDPLENFWRSEESRKRIYSSFNKCNFYAATGPTFSVYKEESKKGPKITDSTSVVMMRRHHKVIKELYDSGICPIPNLYWRNDFDRFQWIQWLQKNESVFLISRDFSATKKGKILFESLKFLIEIIEKVGRKFHVILNGIGCANAEKFYKEIVRTGSSCSCVSSAPIYLGRNGKKLMDSMVIVDSNEPFEQLALNNLLTMTQFMDTLCLD